jgi:hypothetical protein
VHIHATIVQPFLLAPAPTPCCTHLPRTQLHCQQPLKEVDPCCATDALTPARRKLGWTPQPDLRTDACTAVLYVLCTSYTRRNLLVNKQRLPLEVPLQPDALQGTPRGAAAPHGEAKSLVRQGPVPPPAPKRAPCPFRLHPKGNLLQMAAPTITCNSP